MKKRLITLALLLAGMQATGWAENADTTVVVPQTGVLPIKPSRNFTGDKGLLVCSMFGSNSSGLYFTKYVLNEVVMASTTNSSSGLFLVGKPGTYTLTLTDDEVTGRVNSTTISWQTEAGKAYKKDRRLYKFVNEPGRVGFERDENYKADNYQYCDMAEGDYIYLPLADNNLAAIAKLLNTTTEALTFIPWDGPWKNVPTAEEIEAADIKSLNEPTESHQLYDLQGRRIDTPKKGLYIANGKKHVRL